MHVSLPNVSLQRMGGVAHHSRERVDHRDLSAVSIESTTRS
jgi:hypothetical protein